MSDLGIDVPRGWVLDEYGIPRSPREQELQEQQHPRRVIPGGAPIQLDKAALIAASEAEWFAQQNEEVPSG